MRNKNNIENNIERLSNELQQLRVREATIASLLEDQSVSAATRPLTFAIGDRVWIKNRVHKPKAWSDDAVWDESKAKRATVTKVVHAHAQVHFVTDNGVCTWRAPGNLRHLEDE